MELQDEAPMTKAEEEERLDDLYECFLSDAQEALNETVWLQISGELLEVPAVRARQYLHQLGLSAGQVEALECGLYTTRKEILAQLMCRGFSKEDVEASNLLADERWECRLVAPLRDHEGRIRTFWSQDVSNETDSAESCLVLNGETPAYPLGLRPTRNQILGR